VPQCSLLLKKPQAQYAHCKVVADCIRHVEAELEDQDVMSVSAVTDVLSYQDGICCQTAVGRLSVSNLLQAQSS